ncbi:hypothetical protein FB451DRAFT_386270 [Mycena latifolia]|nr:hypothetical protein FB451DRAFT_386270 [Mycena latifolia]
MTLACSPPSSHCSSSPEDNLDDFVPSSQPFDDCVDSDDSESIARCRCCTADSEVVPSSQPFEDGYDDYPGAGGYSLGSSTGGISTAPLVIAMDNTTSPMRPISPFISAHLIRRTSPVKTARWTELRLNPPAYDPEHSRRLVRRVTTPPIKKLPSLFIVSGGPEFSSSESPVSVLESRDSVAASQTRPRSQRRAGASQLLRKIHALEAKLVRMRRKHSKLANSCK